MPYSDYRPDLMGYAALEPLDLETADSRQASSSHKNRFEAGSYQSFKLTYTAGRFGLDDTGSLKIGFRFATDFGPVQFDDPKAPGFTTLEASNGATLQCKWEFKRNIRPWSRALYIGVVKHFLKPGDTITIRFGDRRQGSPGIRMQTYCEQDFEFRVFTDVIATYDYVALPDSPKISIVPGPGVDWNAILPTMVRAGAPFRLCIKANDKWGNPSDQMEQLIRLEPSSPVAGLPKVTRLQRGSFATILQSLKVEDNSLLTIDILDEDGKRLTRSNPMRIAPAENALLHFWGDTHGQSNETLGTNTAEDYFRFGRDKAFLDVMGHQGNDFQITGKFWRELNRLTAEFDVPGEFVCIPGYEWSANTAVGGDRNIHYRHEGETIHRSSHAQIADPTDMVDEESDAHNAHELFQKLNGKDCVVMAHVGGRYADITFAHDAALESAVEVHSAWGTFEWIIWDAFDKGYRVGIVANSDGHKGRPGADYPGASFFGARGGLTCHLAPRLDRDAIFECMRRRHHYATTGNRMILNVTAKLDEDAQLFERDPAVGPAKSAPARRLMLGDIARPAVAAGEVELSVHCVGSAPLERLDIFSGKTLFQTLRPYSDEHLGSRIRVIFEGAEYRGRSRATTWDGKLQIEGNAIQRAEMFNNWNLDRGIQAQDAQHVSWKAVTTGNYCGIDLWLRDARAGTLSIATQHTSPKINICDIGLEDLVIDAGGLERRARLYRLPDMMEKCALGHSAKIPINPTGDTPLFVRVTQEDGHRAWSRFNNWNLDRGIQAQDAQHVSWKAVTTGNYCGIDLWLRDARAGTLSIATQHTSPKINICDIGLEDLVIDAGGLERRARLYRLPDMMEKCALGHSAKIPINPTGDTPLFVRVTQEDGHRAWSSPIYLIR